MSTGKVFVEPIGFGDGVYGPFEDEIEASMFMDDSEVISDSTHKIMVRDGDQWNASLEDIYDIQAAQGWSNTTLMQMAFDFITASSPDLIEAFHRYCLRAQTTENDN